MKVLSLRCSNGHGFEGWFASEDDYQSQNGRGLVECPLCADKVVSRLPSAPRLNLSGAKAPEASVPASADKAPVEVTLQAAWMQAVRHVLANTEDVGERFAEEARRIHYGEAEARGIRALPSRKLANSMASYG